MTKVRDDYMAELQHILEKHPDRDDRVKAINGLWDFIDHCMRYHHQNRGDAYAESLREHCHLMFDCLHYILWGDKDKARELVDKLKAHKLPETEGAV